MYRVIDKRDTGKTKKLLKECVYNEGVFVCRHPERVQEKCIAYGLDFTKIKDVYSHANFIKRYKGSDPVYIDELEKLVLNLVPSMNGYSITAED